MSTDSTRWLNRRNVRIVAIGLLAFPEPVVSDVLAVALFGLSFVLPEGNGETGRACSCGCDYHRCAVHGNQAMGAGALVHGRHWIAPSVHSAHMFPAERHGIAMEGLPTLQPAGSLRNATVAGCDRHPYSWHKWPKLEGALLRRLSGYGAVTAVKCEAHHLSATTSRA